MVWQAVPARGSRHLQAATPDNFEISDCRLTFEGCGSRKCVGERIIPTAVSIPKLLQRLSALRAQFPDVVLVLEEKRFVGAGGKPFDRHLLTATGADVDKVKFCLHACVASDSPDCAVETLAIADCHVKYVRSFLPFLRELVPPSVAAVQLKQTAASSWVLTVSSQDAEAVEDVRICVETHLHYFPS